MTIQITSTKIYIANQSVVDLNESNGFYESAAALSGTFDDLEMVDLTNFDVTEDGVIWSDEIGGGDDIEYTIDGVTYSSPQDAILLYDAVIAERDGTLHNVEGSVVQAPNGDTFVNDKGGTGATDNLNIKTIELTTPTATGSAGRNTFASTENTAVCFCPGTMIRTPCGQRAIETRKNGDRVTCWQGNSAEVEWVGVRFETAPVAYPPVVIAASALGPGVPSRALRVSQQHRVVIRSPIAARMSDVDEVFVAAKNRVGLRGIRVQADHTSVQYWHILCRSHEVVLANDAPAETLFPGSYALKNLPPSALSAIARIKSETPGTLVSKRLFDVPSGRLQRKLVERHRRNSKPLMVDADVSADQP